MFVRLGTNGTPRELGTPTNFDEDLCGRAAIEQ
jgi:hypothetical protein